MSSATPVEVLVELESVSVHRLLENRMNHLRSTL